jgi:DNA-binding XRE family transcriptional regulator
MANNRVLESREQEGISRNAFAGRVGIAYQTLKKVEDGGEVTPPIKHRIVRAFNELPNPCREYTYEYLFLGG